MAIICVDLGGTLIEDPFLDTIDIVRGEVQEGILPFPFPNRFIDEFFAAWTEENWQFDFPFCSHFLQEEFWPMRAALRINDVHGLRMPASLPQMLPAMLSRYRAHVRENIAHQKQLATLRTGIASLKASGHCIGVASNDREFSTRAMLGWSSLDENLSFVFTSEGLSQKYPGAEKPEQEFFRAIQSELRGRAISESPIIYVGDSELKDIIPSLKEKWIAVRFFNSNQNSAAAWLATSNKTSAPVSYSRTELFLDAVQRAVSLCSPL